MSDYRLISSSNVEVDTILQEIREVKSELNELRNLIKDIDSKIDKLLKGKEAYY